MTEESKKSIFDLEEFKPLKIPFEARKARAKRFWKYYKAEVYDTKRGDMQSPMGNYVGSRIANSVRPLFTPLARAVNLDVALIPGSWQLAGDSAQHQEAIRALFRASRWDVEGDLFVKYVMAMGEAGIYVVDDRNNGRVILQSLRPDAFITLAISRFDPTPALAILIEMNGEEEQAIVVDPQRIRTYLNGQPRGLDGNKPEYANTLGFVPLVECKNDPGDGTGEPTFDDAIASLDQVNIQATHLANIIQKHVEPQWAAFGAEAGDLEKSGDTVWFFPEGSDVKAVLAAVDFAGVLSFIQEIKGEVKESLPELSLAELVGVERVAAATIELQMAEAVFKIRRLRKPIDLCLAEAVRLAGRAAVSMKVSELAGLDDPLLEFDKERPVITLDALTRLQVQQTEIGIEAQRVALEQSRLLGNARNGSEVPEDEDAESA